MKRVEDVTSIVLVHEEDYSSPNRNKIRMGNIEAATVRRANDERLETRAQPIANVLQIQHTQLNQLSARQVN